MKKKHISKKYLIKEYIDKDKSYKEIAKNLGVTAMTIGRRLKEHGIKTRPRKTLIDLTDRRFGRLVVLARGITNHSVTKWVCECECGKITEVYRDALLDGRTTSCGCYRVEKMFNGCGDLSGSYWNRIVKGAAVRDLEFSITIEDAWKKFVGQDGKCVLSGINIEVIRDYTRHHDKHTASLDRIDSNLGYTINNIQWVHRDINIMKGKLSQSYFIYLCKEVAKK
jgi:hypothetical protein